MIKNMNDFITRLKTEILKGLPGTDVQWQMASSDRFAKSFPRHPGKDVRQAGVLILSVSLFKVSTYGIYATARL